MTPYSEHFSSHLRLIILRVLSELQDARCNDSMLTDAAHALGLPASRDQVLTEISWLADQGLVVRQVQEVIKLTIAIATDKGLQVAAGRLRVPGVQRPSSKV